MQLDHIDWGFRFSALYGENYRYTTAYGLFSYQLLNHNLVYGFDFPDGLRRHLLPGVPRNECPRAAALSPIPDIEAQLAP